jgi:DNA-binding transcriptional MerR regulator
VAETPSGIPDRTWFKPSEVCEIAAIQPYVLRSWETEFPGLGTVQKGRAGRLYRKADVEQVLRIKRLMLEEGLTLAGVRRRIEGNPPAAQPDVPLESFIGDDARARLVSVREGLRSLLGHLSGGRAGDVRAAAHRDAHPAVAPEPIPHPEVVVAADPALGKPPR